MPTSTTTTTTSSSASNNKNTGTSSAIVNLRLPRVKLDNDRSTTDSSSQINTVTDDEEHDYFSRFIQEKAPVENIDNNIAIPDITYHPTTIFDQDKQVSIVSSIHDYDSNHQESGLLNGLCPPAHAINKRRLSKNITHTPTTATAIAATTIAATLTPTDSATTPKNGRSRRPSFLDNFANSCNSAVSPRFMALRKLSEVSALPSPFSESAPPVPQIPSEYIGGSGNNSLATNNAAAIGSQENINHIFTRVGDIIAEQLQFYLGQMVCEISESRSDTRKFWEEQKKEIIGLTANIVDCMNSSNNGNYQQTTVKSPSSGNADKSEPFQQQYLEAQKQIEKLKSRNHELEKQHQIDSVSLHNLLEENENYRKKSKKVKQDHDRLLEELKSKDKETKHLRSRLESNKSRTKTAVGADGSWADMMQSEDEAKKSAEEWENKYKELLANYFEVCLKLEKKGVSVDEKKMYDASIAEKEKEINQLKQAGYASQKQIESLKLELSKSQKQLEITNKNSDIKRKSQHSNTSGGSNSQRNINNNSKADYVTEDGFLSFTTETNGQLSRYSIKIPTNYSYNSNRNSTLSESKKYVNKLNPFASEWKK